MIAVVVVVACGVVVPLAPPEGTGAHETTVQARAGVDIDDGAAAVDAATATPEDVLLRVTGTSLVHEGGPLAPSRALLRGLGGARVGVSIDELAWGDPATGLWDAAALPWGAAERVVVDSGASPEAAAGLGGGVRLQLAREPGLRARVVAGLLATLRAGFTAVSEGLLVATDVGATNGAFSFRPTSAVGDPGDQLLVRSNNDQRRASALGGAHLRWGDTGVDAVVLAAGHEGGIPGFATSPTRGLRGEDGALAARVAAERTVEGARGRLSVQARGAHQATFGADAARAVLESAFVRVEGSVRVPLLVAGQSARIDVKSGADHAAAVAVPPFARTAADAAASCALPIDVGTTQVRVRADVDARVASDVGLLVGGGARAEIGDVVRASAALSRSTRAPTLDELFAPRGLVTGNPALRPEALHDAEVAVAFVPGARFTAQLIAFAGIVDDGIAYVNRNAYEVQPVNLGSAWRAGVDVALRAEPHALLGLDVVAAALTSRVDATGAPLPHAPSFSSRIAGRVGDAEGVHGIVALRSRGAAGSNAFGTLKAAPYSLVDVLVRAPVGAGLVLGLEVSNTLDATDARDANLLPLPGRLVFLSLEVRT